MIIISPVFRKISQFVDTLSWRLRWSMSDWRQFFLKAWDIFLYRVWTRRRKVTLTYYLPDDDYEYINAMKGSIYKESLQEFDNWFKRSTKHVPEEEWPDIYEVKENLCEILHNNGVSIWGE
jgi:hypothetical protein